MLEIILLTAILIVLLAILFVLKTAANEITGGLSALSKQLKSLDESQNKED